MIEEIKKQLLSARAKQEELKGAIQTLTDKKARLNKSLSEIKGSREAADKAGATYLEDLAFGKLSESEYNEKINDLKKGSKQESETVQMVADINDKLFLLNRDLRHAESLEANLKLAIFREAFNTSTVKLKKDFGEEILNAYCLNVLAGCSGVSFADFFSALTGASFKEGLPEYRKVQENMTRLREEHLG